MENLILVPSVLFLTIVAPIWLILHYRYKSKMSKGISDEEISEVEQMLETLDKLVDRVEALEEILDEEHGECEAPRPTWQWECSTLN